MSSLRSVRSSSSAAVSWLPHLPSTKGRVWAFTSRLMRRASDWREWDVLSTSFHTWKPGLVHDLLLQQLVKMRTDALLKGKGYLMVFAPAVTGPRLGQKVLVDHFGEQNRVSAVSQTNKVEEALRRGRVNIGECHERCGYLWILQIFLIGVGRALDQSLRLLLAELQHQIDCEVVCRVLLVAENWYAQDIKHGMTQLVRVHIEKLTHHSVGRCDPVRCCLLWHRLYYLDQILITNAHVWAVVPCIRCTVTSNHPERQIDR